jgi:hypothetical protein
VAAAGRISSRQVKMLSTVAPVAFREKQSSAAGMLLAATGGMLWLASEPKVTFNHCQVPCGIFDDSATISELKEACVTIRKAIVQSKNLHGIVGSDPLAMNQMVRWINTKEEHCSKIIKLVSEYLLCQRVKRSNFNTEEDYLQTLKFHHIVMQAAMKAKQSMDEGACDMLEHAVADLAKMYSK